MYFRHYSPDWSSWDGGKIGGAPSWLNPRDIPKEPLRCGLCANSNTEGKGTLLRFLCQIYSPADVETQNKDSFHRSIYVFCCPNKECSRGDNKHESVVVLRGQLAKKNDFYPFDCQDEMELKSWNMHETSQWKVNLCFCCGQRAIGKCPTAQKHFCSKEHQKFCLKAMKSNPSVDRNCATYQESELVVEDEPDDIEAGGDDSQEVLVNGLNQTSIFSDTDDNDEEGNDDAMLEQSDLNEIAGVTNGTSDPILVEFYTRIGRSNGNVKSQCLRYNRWPDDHIYEEVNDRGLGPLWISSEGQPNENSDIPPCQYCKSRRKFEFQIMPQILNYLSETKDKKEQNLITEEGKRALMAASDFVERARELGNESDIPQEVIQTQKNLIHKYKSNLLDENNTDEAFDFGTIAVYTCTASCEATEPLFEGLGSYRREFAWRQKPLQ